MSGYFTVKLIHVVSSTLLFGTGLGTAWFVLQAYRSRNIAAMRVTNRLAVRADWLFTTPAVLVQFVTGLWLTAELGIAYLSAWFITVVTLFLLVGACWLPVIWIQIELSRMLADMPDAAQLPTRYHRLMRRWVILGIPAFAGVLMLFALMVFRPIAT